MAIKRRDFLLFLGASAGTIASASSLGKNSSLNFGEKAIAKSTEYQSKGLSFKPIKTPMPLEIYKMSQEEQIKAYSSYEVVDDLVLPEGYTYKVIIAWGDKVGDSHFGYNNDYLSFIETATNQGYLTVNFEYISSKPWVQTYGMVLKKSLPFAEVRKVADAQEGKINAFALPKNDPLFSQIKEIAKESLIELGIGVISLSRDTKGNWQRTYSPSDRRITGISGLEDGRYLKSTGPGVAIFDKAKKKGYDDDLGSKIIGTFQNCAGGTTPWGTVLSAEENFQDQVPESVMADGSSFPPETISFVFTDEDLNGCGNPLGLAGNKYGWIVEVDPANPKDYGTKHTSLGRFRHEAVAIRAEIDKQLVVYSGCDRRGGHVYKFVSTETITDIQDKANSKLLEKGQLYGAKFNPDGTGKWIALTTDTKIDPVLPSQVEGEKEALVVLPNPDRVKGGIVKFTSDAEVLAFKEKFAKLGDLYEGDATEKQGAILVDAHFAANAAGVTCTARPEDTKLDKQGKLYITFTSGTPGSDGGADKNIFVGPEGQSPYEFGWIMSLEENDQEPAAMSFNWQMIAVGGEPAAGGLGFANPDNLEIDANGNIWMVTDMSTSSQNKALESRNKEGNPVSQKNLLGLFGNNSCWFIPTSGANAGMAYPFAITPMDTESTGPFFTKDEQSLFLSIQHPGEVHGMRQNLQVEERQFLMLTTDGKEFIQKRQLPIGSNWPGKNSQDPPLPAVVVIQRQDAKSITFS